jgi:hypothetical protein
MCKNHEERLLNELLNELQMAESLSVSLERTDTLPFYRFNHSPSTFSTSSYQNHLAQLSEINTIRKLSIQINNNENRGVLHTKRHHSGEDALQQDHVAHLSANKMRTSSQSSLSTSLNDKLNAEPEKGEFTCLDILMSNSI